MPNQYRERETDEDAALRSLWASRKTIEEIADELQRGPSTVKRWAESLGLPKRGRAPSLRPGANMNRVTKRAP